MGSLRVISFAPLPGAGTYHGGQRGIAEPLRERAQRAASTRPKVGNGDQFALVELRQRRINDNEMTMDAGSFYPRTGPPSILS
jgi:hypothetical protein